MKYKALVPMLVIILFSISLVSATKTGKVSSITFDVIDRPYYMSENPFIQINLINNGTENYDEYIILHVIAPDGTDYNYKTNTITLKSGDIHAGTGTFTNLPTEGIGIYQVRAELWRVGTVWDLWQDQKLDSNNNSFEVIFNKPSGNDNYLSDDDWHHPSNSYIRDYALHIVAGATSPDLAARKLNDWVQSYITYSQANVCDGTNAPCGDRSQDYLILIYKMGDCNDFADLYISLTRTINIPSRFISIAWVNNSYGSDWLDYGPRLVEIGHATAESMINSNWIPVDPTWDVYNNPLIYLKGGYNGQPVHIIARAWTNSSDDNQDWVNSYEQLNLLNGWVDVTRGRPYDNTWVPAGLFMMSSIQNQNSLQIGNNIYFSTAVYHTGDMTARNTKVSVSTSSQGLELMSENNPTFLNNIDWNTVRPIAQWTFRANSPGQKNVLVTLSSDDTNTSTQNIPFNVITCSKNSDCGNNSFIGSGSCSGNNLTGLYVNYTCVNPNSSQSYCMNTTKIILKQTCSGACSNGTCITCSKNSDCGQQTTNKYCDSQNNSYDSINIPTCMNSGSVNSICYNETQNVNTIYCNKGCIDNIGCYIDELNIISPISGYYNAQNILFNINLNKTANEIDYIDNSNTRPKWITLCKNCNTFSKVIKFSDGNHSIGIKAILSDKVLSDTTNLFIDSKNPSITSSYPKSNSFINGSYFNVNYNENNLVDIYLIINPVSANQQDNINRLIRYINNSLDAKVDYISINDIGIFYQINISYSEQNFPVYVTKDWKYMFTSLIFMNNTSIKDTSADSIINNFILYTKNQNLSVGYTSYEDLGSMYSVQIIVQNQKMEVYLTKDGKYFATSEFIINDGERKDCNSGNKQDCLFNSSLKDYEGKNIEYHFLLKDISGNIQESKPVKLTIDTISPIINNPNTFWSKDTKNQRYVNFNISINETNFDSVKYIDSFDGTRAKWNTLCSRLNKNNECVIKKSFKTGTHNLTIQVSDKAGNSIQTSLVVVV